MNTSTPTWRRFKDRLAFFLGAVCVFIAMIPLVSILFEVVRNGISVLSVEFLTSTQSFIALPSGGAAIVGGVGVSIEGTLVLIGLTAVMAVPIGILAGAYLAEFGNNRVGNGFRFLNDVLSQFPSIVIGILVYSILVVGIRLGFTPVTGAVALSIIMLPIVTRTTEESIKLVPRSVRDAAMALGIRKWRSTVSVVLSTARSGIVTGALLSIARISGETAPLLMTIGTSQYFLTGLNQQADALPVRIFLLSSENFVVGAQHQGWGAALVLILIVLCLNLSVRIATRGKYGAVRSRI
ncbi:MAG TPA: phosphate ABC transporter permease PstA [Candidatus Bathyarchaeia archaeon]|jgi:phosphate transport system permease protein|nr:phosphate ABC transporter permease PstA [Candidatus Bathyarchaeia archaeon]